jgi:hypothetical protein
MSMVPRPPRKKGVQPVATNHNHVVRVTVLGLAGITVDRLKCRDKSNQPSAPVEPRKMKAVVAFSRNSNMKGMSALSKPLARSPADDIVVGQQGKVHIDDETATNTTDYVDRPQRHVAVWASDTSSLGSVVTFEVPLMSFEKEPHAPKSLDLTIALAEDDQSEHHVALPFGVATLAIAGNECKHGGSIKLDLPVLSLSAARPLKKVGGDKRKGVSGYPMIAISPKTKDLPKKRSGLQRLFNRQQKVQVPTETARNSFADAYAMDTSGDAILRVSLEIYEKRSELEKTFKSRNLRGDSSIASYLVPYPQRQIGRPDPVEVPFDERSKRRSYGGATIGAPSDEENTLATKGDATLNTTGESYDAATNDDSDTYDGTFEGTFEGTFFDDDDESAGSETYATNEENVGFFTWPNPVVDDDDHDSYTLSFEKKEDIVEAAEKEEGLDPFEIDFFGAKIRIPMCASLPLMRQTQDDDASLVTRATKSGLNHMVHDFQDDMTHVTADFFGKSYRIPVCAAIRGVDGDDFTLVTEGDTLTEEKGKEKKVMELTDKVCRGEPDEELELSKTFSTLSDGRGDTTTGVASKQGSRGTTIKELLEKREVKVPSTPEKGPKKEVVPKDSPATQSATDWLLFPKKGEQKLKKSTSEASPTTIYDFPPMEAAKPQEDVKAKDTPVAKTFTDFFGFKREVASTTPVKYEPYQQEVPPVVIPDEEASVGELTANTFEANIASEAQILERYRKKFNKQAAQAKRGRMPHRMTGIPVAFGGDGMCPGMTVQVASSPIRVTSGGSNSLIEGAVKQRENYFAEYDDFSILSPASESKAAVSPSPRSKETPIGGEPEKEEKLASKPTELKASAYKSDKVSKKNPETTSRKITRSSSRVR